MDEPEVERLLQRYRPVGAPGALRDRVLALRLAPPPAWPWVAAAAVLLASTVGLHVATAREAGQADAIAAPESARHLVDHLTAMLGDDDAARRWAERMVVEQQVRSEGADGVKAPEVPTGREQP